MAFALATLYGDWRNGDQGTDEVEHEAKLAIWLYFIIVIFNVNLQSNNGRYLAELLAEKHKLVPFTQVLPLCTRLVNQDSYLRFIIMSALSV
ncbi:hypothetical protein EPI10_027565 [Gossypium australe]|uniref:STAR protein homodimerisation region domain-containing protein n=1 Tax=Gossypium australe TaxID=47621 RepID=A0A5B6US85_9ROSI|nr:hypothetical protein EPI10_027565 [Gossypium australe]